MLRQLINIDWLSKACSNKSPIAFDGDSEAAPCLHNAAAAGCALFHLPHTGYDDWCLPPTPGSVWSTHFQARWWRLMPGCILCIFICPVLRRVLVLPRLAPAWGASSRVHLLHCCISRQELQCWMVLQNSELHRVTRVNCRSVTGRKLRFPAQELDELHTHPPSRPPQPYSLAIYMAHCPLHWIWL